MVSQPCDRVIANAGTGSRARVAVIVGRFSNRRSWENSARISVGVNTWNRAAPADTAGAGAAAGEGGGASSPTASAPGPQRLTFRSMSASYRVPSRLVVGEMTGSRTVKLVAAGLAASLVVVALAVIAGPAGASTTGAPFRVGAAVQSFSPPAAGAIQSDPADCASAADAAFNGPRKFAFEEPYIDQQRD